MSVYVPPGGFAGWSQMTAASKAGQAGGKMRATKRGRARKKRAGSTPRRKSAKTRARKATGRKLKFGSPAWRKKYMRKK